MYDRYAFVSEPDIPLPKSSPDAPSVHSVILSKNHLPAPCFLKTRAILTPLEVYMVNSPSRLNTRPVDLPPLGWSVRLTLPLPAPGPVPHGVGTARPHDHRCWSAGRPPGPSSPQSRQKPLYSCIIKAYQGIRQNSRSAPVPGRSNGQTCQPHCHAKKLHPPRPEIRDPSCEPCPPSRQKAQQSRLIVPHQGISRHPQKTAPWSLVLGASLEFGGWTLGASSPLRLLPRKLCAFLNCGACYSIVCLSVN